MLVDGKVDSPEGASTNLLLDDVLVDTMDCTPVVFAIGVF